MLLSSCAVVCVDGGVIFLVYVSLTVIGKVIPCDFVLGVPLFVVTVMRDC